MERLTYRRDIDDAVCIKDMRPHNAPVKVQEVAERLSAYEDILFDAYGKEICTVEHLTELVKAEQKRREGCGFCNIELDDYPYIAAHGEYCCSDTIYKPAFCPMCGRDLRGESHDR